MSIFPKSKVPQFKLRPDPIATFLFILVFISGLLISLSFFKAEDGSGVYFQKGLISSIFTGLISLCLLFAATSKLLFSHLWKKIPLMIGIECIVKIIQWKKKKPLRKKFVKNKKFACGYLQNLSWLKDEHCMRRVSF